MSMNDCIQRAVDAGMLSRKRAAAAQELLAERIEAHASLGPGAQAAAAEDVWLKLRKDFQQRKRASLMQIAKSQEIIEDITRFVDSDGTKNPAQAIRQKLEWGQSAEFQSVAAVQDALAGSYRRRIAEFLQQHKRTVTGSVRNKARLPHILKELMGEATGDVKAREMADAISATLEQARLDFNAAGGSIGKLSDFGLPHAWDKARLLKLAKEPIDARAIWTRDIAPRLDWDRIPDNATGRMFAGSAPAARQKFLDDIFDTITGGGWNRREPSGVAVGKSTAHSRSDARVLHFRSADDWMAANEAFGRSDAFATIVTHLDTMARDTAMMRILGPNPRAGLQMAIQTALKLAVDRPWTPSRKFGIERYSTADAEVTGAAAQAERMLALVNGSANSPEADVVASAFSGVRHFLIASQLGGAVLSAVSDVGFMAMASRHVGMDWDRVLGRHLKSLASSESRALMARAGIVAESVANVGVAQSRLMGDAYGPEVAERLSEFTMRSSGLTAWTEMGRGAFRLSMYGFLAENAGRSWADIDKPLRELVFKARGITEADWNDIRATKLFRDASEPDASFLIPDDIRYRTDLDPERALDLSLKLESAVLEQMEFAVPSASLRGRATMDGGRPGSLTGELMRSGVMYKSFMFSLMYNQLGRVFHHKVNGSRAANIAMFATITTMAGALSMQLKEMEKGRDLRDMSDGKFWMAAAIQGGGAGIFGDFLYATENRFGNSVGATIAGPGAGLLEDTLGLTGSVRAALVNRDEDSMDKLGRTATRFANKYSGPTNLWYANLALDRMLWDNLQELVDGNAAASFRRAESRRVTEYGNPSYWPPGMNVPGRGPDLTNAIGGTSP